MFLKALTNCYDFLHDEEAATAVEYAIMIVLIAAVVIVAVGFLGRETEQSFNSFIVTFNSVK